MKLSGIAGLGLLLAALPGCKRDTAIDGLEAWRFGQTTAKDGVVCSARDQYTFCSQNGSVKVAGQDGTVNLYFRGKGDDAPLIEIEVEFLRCKPDAILQALAAKLGTEVERVGRSTVIWSGPKAIILGELPADDGVCLVHFVAPDDADRLSHLRAESK